MAVTIRLNGSLVISGLTAGQANTIKHGLPVAPTNIKLRPNVEDRLGEHADLWLQSQPADATNVYVTVAVSGPTSGTVDFWLPTQTQ
jgi:hypothetical protein